MLTLVNSTDANNEIVPEPHGLYRLGSETKGLPSDILSAFPVHQRLRVPMLANQRSLNLSNAAAIVTYEAWRQNGFQGI